MCSEVKSTFLFQGIQGEYQYQAPDGTNVRFSYVADENGYQPQVKSTIIKDTQLPTNNEKNGKSTRILI